MIGRSFLKSLKPVALALTTLALSFTLVASSRASVHGYGSNYYGETTVPQNLGEVIGISAGPFHSVAVKADGTVAAWGGNSSGQCNVPAGLTGVVAISAGGTNTLALKSNGTVVAWGDDAYGQNDTSGLSGVQAISCGLYANLFLKANGSVVARGSNDRNPGILDVPSGLTAVSISLKGLHALAVRTDGTVVAWGNNRYGQCNVPSDLSDVVQVSGSLTHSLALKSNGTVVAWGSNGSGESTVPAGLTGVVDISAGINFSLALKSDGTVVAWGSNYSGQFPATSGKVTMISAGQSHSLTSEIPAAQISLSSNSLVAGSTTSLTGRCALLYPATSPQTIALTSSDPTHAKVPATVTVPTGATSVTFTVTTSAIPATSAATITATYLGGTDKAAVTLSPFTVKSLALTQTSSEGGFTFNGFVTLNATPRAAFSVPLSATDSTYITLPSACQINPSNAAGVFSFTTVDVPTNWATAITATTGGTSKTANFKLLATPRIKAFRLASTWVYGQQKTTGTITLTFPARYTGLDIAVVSNAPATVPATVHFDEGQTTATFDIVGNDLSSTGTASIQASTTYSAYGQSLVVKPIAVKSVSLSSKSIHSGETSLLTVTLFGTVAVDTNVDLSCTVAGVVNMPTTVTIPAGSSTATVTLTGAARTTVRTTSIMAGRVGSFQHVQLTVGP